MLVFSTHPAAEAASQTAGRRLKGREPAPSPEGGFIPQAHLTSVQKLPPEEMSAEDDVSSVGAALGEAGLA